MDSMNAFKTVIAFIYEFLNYRLDIFGFDLSLLECFCGAVLLGIAGYVTFRILD